MTFQSWRAASFLPSSTGVTPAVWNPYVSASLSSVPLCRCVQEHLCVLWTTWASNNPNLFIMWGTLSKPASITSAKITYCSVDNCSQYFFLLEIPWFTIHLIFKNYHVYKTGIRYKFLNFVISRNSIWGIRWFSPTKVSAYFQIGQ